MKYSEAHHFADDANLYFNNSVKFINRKVNHDLKKDLSYWLRANKITLNVGKTKLVLFTSSKKQLNRDFKTKIDEKMLYETDSVKYLETKVAKKLRWKQ